MALLSKKLRNPKCHKTSHIAGIGKMSSNRFKISDQPLSIVFHTGSTCHAKKELSSAKNKKAIPELKETASNDKPLENPETCRLAGKGTNAPAFHRGRLPQKANL